MSASDAADEGILELAGRLQALQDQLGETYWTDPDARELRDELKAMLGMAAGHDPDGPPAHARARRSARWEAQYARLLWPW